MSNTNTGGPAFPYVCDADFDYGTGMTLRDYFAAKAMQAILQSGGQWGKQTADALHYEDDGSVMSAAMCLAEGSYQMADAMIKVKARET